MDRCQGLIGTLLAYIYLFRGLANSQIPEAASKIWNPSSFQPTQEQCFVQEMANMKHPMQRNFSIFTVHKNTEFAWWVCHQFELVPVVVIPV